MGATLKKGRATQKLWLLVEVGPSPADLTGKTLEVKMALPDESSPITITSTIPAQTGGDVGRFNCDVTAANLTALSDPEQVLIVWNLWNVDGSQFQWGSALFDVKL